MRRVAQEQDAYYRYNQTREEQHQAERDGDGGVALETYSTTEETLSWTEFVGCCGEVIERGEVLRRRDSFLEVLHNAHFSSRHAATWGSCAEARAGDCVWNPGASYAEDVAPMEEVELVQTDIVGGMVGGAARLV